MSETGHGPASAERRVRDLFARYERVDPEQLRRLALSLPDEERRGELVAAAERAAATSGRGELLARARQTARELVVRAYADGMYRPTWLTLNWGQSLGTVADRAAHTMAVEDAAAAAVVADLEPDLAEELAWAFERLVELRSGGPPPESLEYGLQAHPRIGWLLAVAVLLVTAGIAVVPALALPAVGLALAILFLGSRRARRREPADDA